MSHNNREMIHLSIGSTACQVAAHWHNLQGLAATSDSCEAHVTHSTFQQYYVPRAIMIDRPAAFVRRRNSTEANSMVWSGAIETLECPASQSKQPENDPFTQLFQTAARLAYAPYSRYKAAEESRQQQYSSSGRHVNWDEEDSAEDDEEAARSRQRQQQRQQQEWYDSTFQPLQAELEEHWSYSLEPHKDAKAVSSSTPSTDAVEKQQTIAWIDYWMPPYDPRSCLALPQDSTVTADWETYQSGIAGINTRWKEDELFERIRRTLEDCDLCQGFMLLTSSSSSMAGAPANSIPSSEGWAAGLTTAVLQELQDECPAGQRMVVSIEEEASTKNESQVELQTSSTETEPVSWQTRNMHRVRGQVERGLALQHYRELAQVVLPLRLPMHNAASRFDQTAWVAASLESVTLPYRLRHNPDLSLVGMNSSYYSGNFSENLSFGTSTSLSFREYLHQLRPSSQHIVLELDTILPSTRLSAPLEALLVRGTSIERDARMRQGHSGSRNASSDLPGMWAQPIKHGGIMSSLSPTGSTANEDRSLHRHFASLAALRPTQLWDSPPTPKQPGEPSSLTRYLTCLMEGIGPRFSTQQSAATVVQQSLLDLTTGGYGAGSYWRHVWRSNATDSANTNRTVLALLGNTTRRYNHLDLITNELKDGLSSRFRGYYNRDVEQGALPEREDCEDALAACLDLRDAYSPPEGSGLVGGHVQDF